MLKKLFKYDIIYFSKIMLPAYLIFAAVTLFFRIMLAVANSSPVVAGFAVVSAISYFLGLAAISIISFLIIAIIFYKNVFSNEGYLTNTLPVKPWAIITSKLLAGTVFSIISLIVICLSALTLLAFQPNGDGGTIIGSLYAVLDEVFDFLKKLLADKNVIITVINYSVYAIISFFSSLLMVFFAISLGQTARKNKILASVGYYIVCNIAKSFITTLISIPSIISAEMNSEMLTSASAMFSELNIMVLITNIVVLLLSVIFFAGTNYMMTNKLNLA